ARLPKEAERFLLWAIVDRGKPVSSMANEDCIVYREFLGDPQPASHWCAASGRERWSPLWRPSVAAQRQGDRDPEEPVRFTVAQWHFIEAQLMCLGAAEAGLKGWTCAPRRL